MKRRPTSLRRLLTLLGVGQLLYLAAIGTYLGVVGHAAGRLADADREQVAVGRAFEGTPAPVYAELLREEREHARAATLASRLVAGWILVGIAVMAAMCVVLHRRLYVPLTRLERGLTRVAAGELDARLDLHGVEELGRLGGMFNRMTEVLRAREQEAADARSGIVESFGRILAKSGGKLVALDATSLEVIDANHRALERLGYERDELLGLDAHDLWCDEFGRVTTALQELAAGRRDNASFSTEMRRKNGSTYPVEVTAYRLPDQDPPAIILISQDLSERRRLENIQERLARFALEKSAILQSGNMETGLQAITELAVATLDVDRASVWRYEDDGVRCLDAFERTTGLHTVGDFLDRASAPAYFEALSDGRTIDAEDARADPRTVDLAERYLASNGVAAVLDAPVRVAGRLAGVACHEHRGRPRPWSAEERVFAGAIADFVTQVLEVADRQRAEHALLESEQRYRAAFEQAAVGIAETDPKGNFLQANPRLQEMLGYTRDELLRLCWRDVIHRDDQANVEAGFRELRDGLRPSYQRECRGVRRDGSTLWLDISASPEWREDGTVARLIAVAADMSEAHDLQAQLVHAQRMESIGRLAGGIAHDFNNLLTAILGHAELGAASVAADAPVRDDLRQIEESALRASSLTRQLLTFARRQVVEPRIVELDELTRNTERLLRRLIGEDVELETEFGASGATVRIDPGLYEQVIVNLAVNARDAMAGGGRLRIASRPVELREEKDAALHDLEPGRYVELIVQDTGSGMSEEVLERIFEPFFTTKPAGEGTGLGLATCYGIVGQAGGRIRVKSVVGEGTTFKIFLPRVRGRADVPDVARTPALTGGGHETVLVAEDEESVRRLVVESLRQRGYRVLAAADGMEALRIAATHDGAIDILVTDIVMPRMRGPELSSRLRTVRPGVKVLFMSGYPGNVDTVEALTTDESAFLAKPFTPSQLATRVGTLLDAERG